MSIDRNNTIAIIGIGCRLPGGVQSPRDLWQLLLDAKNVIGDIPESRWDIRSLRHADPARPGRMYVTRGGFLDHVDRFDAAFFGITPKEASRMDPQQRILLQVVWEALEDAGIPASRLAGTDTGVFIGISTHDYETVQQGDMRRINAYTNTGGAHSIAANRISHALDLKGPSFALDTACSSALVALHQACVSLQRGESALAFVGGVNIICTPEPTIGFCKASMLSKDGQCFAFDARANGYVRSEGAGVVLLKPLNSALADQDQIYALIRGTGINQDGRTRGISQPDGDAQEALLRKVCAEAGVDPKEIDYVEAHGTGTPLGDPVECGALGRALGAGRSRNQALSIGSIKTNIGHLEAGSGIAGLIKLSLALRHGIIPATLNFEEPNPDIDFDGLGLRVQTEASAWPVHSHRPPRAGINSFGFGGANAHALLEAHPQAPQLKRRDDLPLLVLSARSAPSLDALAAHWIDKLEKKGAIDWESAALHRDHHDHRLSATGADAAELVEALKAALEKDPHPRLNRGKGRKKPKIAFAFCGNGPQWHAMGRELFQTEPVYRQTVKKVDREYRRLFGISVLSELVRSEADHQMARTEIAQPTLFALQLGLVALWKSWGITPAAVIGHSVGEIAAAHTAGILNLDQAIRVIHHRSQAQGKTAGNGRMAAVGLSASEIAKIISPYKGQVWIAAINSSQAVTLSGDEKPLIAVGEHIKAQGAFWRMLQLDYAFHSHHMDPIEADIQGALAELSPGQAQIPFASAVTGKQEDGTALTADYWWKNIRDPVLFSAAAKTLSTLDCQVVLEIGPHPVLRSYLQQCFEGAEILPSLRRKEREAIRIRHSMGAIYCLGADLNWPGICNPKTPKGELPGYPWDNQRHWIFEEGAAAKHPVHPLLGRRLNSASPQWEAALDHSEPEWIADHVVQDATVLPGAAFAEMALAIAKEQLGDSPRAIGKLCIHKPLVLSGAERIVQSSLDIDDGTIRISSKSGERWILHLSAELRPLTPDIHAPMAQVQQIMKRCTQGGTPEEIYAAAASRGLQYGPVFQGIQRLWIGVKEALGKIHCPEAALEYALHPALLDACIQVVFGVVDENERRAWLPVRIDQLRFFQSPGEAAWCHVRVLQHGEATLTVDLRIMNEEGLCCADFRGFKLQAINFEKKRPTANLLYGLKWMHPAPHGAAEVWPDIESLPCPQSTPSQLALRAAQSRVCSAFAQEALDQQGATADPKIAAWLKSIHCPKKVESEKADALWKSLVLENPGSHAEHALLGWIGRNALSLLHGKISLKELQEAKLFSATRKHFYESSPLVRPGHLLLQSAIARLVNGQPKYRGIRVLEICAGRGGATRFIQAALPKMGTGYWRSETDEEQFLTSETRHPELKSLLFDPKRPLGKQGIEVRDFDLIVAAHAFGDGAELGTAMANIKDLLAPGGQLLILEGTEATPLLDLALPDWRGCSAKDWLKTLSDAGFEQAQAHPDGAMPMHHLFSARKARTSLRKTLVQVRKNWLLFCDQTGLGCRLREMLEERGDKVICVMAEQSDVEGVHIIDPIDPLAMEALLQDLNAVPLEGIIHMWSLDAPHNKDLDTEALNRAENSQISIMHFLQAWMRRRQASTPRFWILSAGAQAQASAEDIALAQTPTWGLGRVMMNEHPEFHPTLIDLSAKTDTAELETLVEIFDADPKEDEIAIRGQRWLVSRLEREGFGSSGEQEGFRLEIDSPGVLDRLKLKSAPRREPGPGEVEIEVLAAGLNFRDVMWAMGMLSLEALEGGFAGPSMGMECAGKIIRIGSGVENLAIGDRVMAFAPACFGRFTTTLSAAVGKLPDAISNEAGATIPTVFLTAWYALVELANIQPGEKLLIHGAAGGVGLAAIQIGQLLGAELFCTAGTPMKRSFLSGLGVQHVLNSRSLRFAEDIHSLTEGEGIDVVLNSLAGDGMRRSMGLLKPFGRFLEIGKRDFYADSRIGLRPFRNNLSYFGIDADQLLLHRPDKTRQMFKTLCAHFEAGSLYPLPYRLFALDEAVSAFRLMQRSQHIGKLVIQIPEAVNEIQHDPREFKARPDGRYLLSGGLGGFGLATARWLVQEGASNLVLVGRSGAKRPAAQAAVAELRALGATVEVENVDICDSNQVAALFAKLGRSGPPVRGILHAATVLEDGILLQLNADRFRKATGPKVHGAWNLHRHSLDCPLDIFMMYSSFTAMVGNAGQANYVAGNAFLDGLARHRRSLGRPGISVAWGAISEVGLLARNAPVAERLARHGVKGLSPELALKALGSLLNGSHSHIGVVDCDWDQWQRAAGNRQQPKLQLMARSNQAETEVESLHFCGSPEEQRDQMLQVLIKQVALVIQSPANRIDLDQPISELGLDSLMAVELRSRVDDVLGIDIPVMQLMQGQSIREMALMLFDRGTPRQEGAKALLRHGSNNPKVSLICLPHMGGSASTFSLWADSLPEHVEVLSVNLPGHEGRWEETPLGSVSEILDEIQQNLPTQLAEQIVIYGHSMGAILGYELAKRLEKDGRPPAHLISAAYSAPHLPCPFSKVLDAWSDDIFDRMTDASLAISLQGLLPDALLSDQSLRRAILPKLNVELNALHEYQAEDTEPLPCPITVLSGKDDAMVDPESLKSWEEHTLAESNQITLPGGHLFLLDSPQPLLAVISDVLEPLA